MPQRKIGLKALRKNYRRRVHNLYIKKELKKTVKKFLSAVNAKNKAEAQTNLQVLFKRLDKAAKTHLLHKNTAARRKSQYSRLLAGLN